MHYRARKSALSAEDASLGWIVCQVLLGEYPRAVTIGLQDIRLTISLSGSTECRANHSPRWRFSHRSSIRFMKPDGPLASD